MARATSSLPVPLSPVISTGTSHAAKRRTCSKTSRIAGLLPTMKTVGGTAVGRSAAASSPEGSLVKAGADRCIDASLLMSDARLRACPSGRRLRRLNIAFATACPLEIALAPEFPVSVKGSPTATIATWPGQVRGSAPKTSARGRFPAFARPAFTVLRSRRRPGHLHCSNSRASGIIPSDTNGLQSPFHAVAKPCQVFRHLKKGSDFGIAAQLAGGYARRPRTGDDSPAAGATEAVDQRDF